MRQSQYFPETRNNTYYVQELFRQFKQFSPARQIKFSNFMAYPDTLKQKTLEDMKMDQFQEYFSKLTGPKLRHCSTQTKEFCLDWFKKETNISRREEAIALYEDRIAIEENLTYVFESFPENIRKKYHQFYESQFDVKETIIAEIKNVINEQEKADAEFQNSKAEITASIDKLPTDTPASLRLEFHQRLAAATTLSELSRLKGRISSKIDSQATQEKQTIQTNDRRIKHFTGSWIFNPFLLFFA